MNGDWYNGLDLGKLVGFLFIDLKKAFDTVDHDILSVKLELYGVQKRELSCFRPYLSNRDSDLKKLETWLQGNKLQLNVAKSHVMLIPTKQKGISLKSRNEALELKIRDSELEVVQKTRYL